MDIAAPKRRVRGLDGLRGLAIILVLFSHLIGFTGAGLVGVLVFFVLSGYLITSLLLREHASAGRVDLGRFYIRRGLRLLPALGLLLALVWLATLVPTSGLTVSDASRGSVHALFYVTDFVLGLQLEYVPELAHLWTLAVEEQFYLVWPLVLITIVLPLRANARVRMMAWLIGLGVILRIVTILVGSSAGLFFYALPTTWVDGILIGCALAVLVHERPTWGSRLSQTAAHPVATVLAWLTVLGFAFHPDTYYAPLTYVIGIPAIAVATGCLMLAVTGREPSLTRRVLDRPVMRWFGDHSYGLYLFNSLFVLVATSLAGPGPATRVIAMLAAVVVATLSRRFVEQPALDLKSRIAA